MTVDTMTLSRCVVDALPGRVDTQNRAYLPFSAGQSYIFGGWTIDWELALSISLCFKRDQHVTPLTKYA